MGGLPERIAVVGGGIGGLTFAAGLRHFLKDTVASSVSIKVYDQAPELKPNLGGAFKLDAGASALREIGLEDEYLRRSQPYDHAVFKTESGSSLGQINIGKLFTKTALRRDTKTHESRPHIGGLMMREQLQHMLAEKMAPNTIVLDKHLEELHDDGDKIVLGFSDGSEESADLVVGADGLRSAVRELAFGENFAPNFTGYQVQYVVSQTNCLPDATISHTLGDGIYVWSTACGPKDSRHEVMTIYRRYDVELPEDWFAAEKSVKQDVLELLEQHGYPEEFRTIASKAQRIFNLGIYASSSTGMPSWITAREKVVLLGDACHATTPFLAAGANMAVEDGVCLAKELTAAYNTNAPLKQCLERYQTVRQQAAQRLVLQAEEAGALLIAAGMKRTVNNARLYASILSGKLARDLVARGQPTI